MRQIFSSSEYKYNNSIGFIDKSLQWDLGGGQGSDPFCSKPIVAIEINKNCISPDGIHACLQTQSCSFETQIIKTYSLQYSKSRATPSLTRCRRGALEKSSKRRYSKQDDKKVTLLLGVRV